LRYRHRSRFAVQSANRIIDSKIAGSYLLKPPFHATTSGWQHSICIPELAPGRARETVELSRQLSQFKKGIAQMQLSLGHQLFQLSGALLILLAYAGHQMRWVDARRPLYNIFNGLGSAILGFYAFWPRMQAGFIVLEVMWTAISIYALARAVRGESRATQAAD
jgi:hypothetical protein